VHGRLTHQNNDDYSLAVATALPELQIPEDLMLIKTESIAPTSAREIVIEAGRAEHHYWRDLWHYREPLRVLAWRDVAVRYKQTVFGLAWAVIRPFLTMVIFTVVFSKLANLPSEGAAPYPIMVFAGMLPWTFFSSALADASNSVLGGASLITKIYFPRLILP